jgi:HD-like signal output (HDOD) protein
MVRQEQSMNSAPNTPMHRIIVMPQVPDLRTVYLTELLIDQLPSLSRPMHDLYRLLEADIDPEKISATLMQDLNLCMHFVELGGLAELAAFAISLDHLVVMLGKSRVWTVAVGAFLLKEIETSVSIPVLSQVRDLARQQASIALSEATAREEPACEQAYVYGLLSVIGLLPLIELTALEEDIQGWVGISAAAVAKQRQYFGTDYIELSRWIKRLWHVPLDSPYSTKSEQQFLLTAAAPARL